MIRKYLCLLLSTILLFSKLNAAANNLDIYGVDPKTKNKMMACCEKNIHDYVALQQHLNLSQEHNSEQDLKRQLVIEQSLLKKINRLGNFTITKISTVYYPDDKTTFTTIDVVNTIDSYRLPISSKRLIKKYIDKSEGLTHLFKIWEVYTQRNFKLMQSSNPDFKSNSCPVVHCIWGFDKKELQYDFPELKKGASKYRNQLMDIIEHSANNKDREQAVFILAHINNYQELAHFLMKFTNDPDDGVRNNTMRVLGAILAQHKVSGLDLDQILKALDYPYVTDRNKAGYILLNIVLKNKSSHQFVIKRSGDTLINLLKLYQPNNHDFAYRILKAISKKDYSERDYQSWQNWVDSEKKKLNV